VKILFLVNDYLTSPLGVAYLSAALNQHGHRSEVAALRDSARQRRLLAEFTPDFLALSLVSGRHPYFVDVARLMKKEYPRLVVLGGGPHPTFFPEFITEDSVDAICRGEGEIAMPALVNYYQQHRALPADLPNWWVKQPDGSIVRNEVGNLVADLNTLPHPDRDIFDRIVPPSSRVAVFSLASRGCPYQCSYCFNHAYLELYRGRGTMCRRRSVPNLLGELADLKSRYRNLQIIIFQDDTFILNREWLEEFVQHYPREIGIPFHCHLRANLVDESIVSLLRRSGCLSVKLALESAADSVRNGVLNRNISRQQFAGACRALHKYGIHFVTQNILGVPTSTLGDDISTYDFNLGLRPHYMFATLLQIYPGTKIAEFAAKHGYAQSSEQVFPSTFFEDSQLEIPHKVERKRLRALFAFGVNFGIPTGFIHRLIRLPLRWLYELVDKFWKGYAIRFRIYPYRTGFGGFIREVRTFLRENYY